MQRSSLSLGVDTIGDIPRPRGRDTRATGGRERRREGEGERTKKKDYWRNKGKESDMEMKEGRGAREGKEVKRERRR